MSIEVMKDFNEYKDKGLTGLANIGNSCYLNSCLQILSHTYELSDFLNDDKYKTKLNRCPESVMLLEWDKLRILIWSENCTVAPWGFTTAIRKISQIKDYAAFSGFSQNDIQEFLYFLIDSFHISLSREVEMNIQGNIENKTDKLAKTCYEMMQNMYKKEYSEMLNIFYGISISQLTSIDDKETILSISPEPFSTLSLSIPNINGQITIFDCLDEYCKKERMEGDCAWYNEDTNQKQSVDKGITFWSLPNILIIDLKRFTNNMQKIQKQIYSPLENNDFSKYVKGYNSTSYIYDLYAVCNHVGGMGGGHYFAYIKTANEKWYSFNDSDITEIQDLNQIITNKVYCLFYRKKK
jgi:ubiquitin C-terminal hydrolase